MCIGQNPLKYLHPGYERYIEQRIAFTESTRLGIKLNRVARLQEKEGGIVRGW